MCRASFLSISDPYHYGIPQKAAVMRGDVANLPVLLRKPGQLSNPRFVAWPLEFGLGTLNPRFVAWPLELGLGTLNSSIDSLGNIVWICPLALGTSADLLIWDREGPKRSKGHYMDYGIGSMDGAYKGRLHVAWPFIGRKMLTERQKEYNAQSTGHVLSTCLHICGTGAS